jgi:hypothetical protein
MEQAWLKSFEQNYKKKEPFVPRFQEGTGDG